MFTTIRFVWYNKWNCNVHRFIYKDAFRYATSEATCMQTLHYSAIEFNIVWNKNYIYLYVSNNYEQLSGSSISQLTVYSKGTRI